VSLVEETANWILHHLGEIVFLVFGALLGFLPSLLTWRVQRSDEEKQLSKQSFADLTAELEQNRRYQSTSHHIEQEDGSYKRFRERGFFYQLPLDLQKDLQELYASIHERNGLIRYYNSVGLAALSAKIPTLTDPSFLLKPTGAEAKVLLDILAIIRQREENIAGLIDKILPRLKALSDEK